MHLTGYFEDRKFVFCIGTVQLGITFVNQLCCKCIILIQNGYIYTCTFKVHVLGITILLLANTDRYDDTLLV